MNTNMPLLRDVRSMLDLASISSHDILVNKLKTDVRMRTSYATALALQPFMYRSDGTYYELMDVYVHGICSATTTTTLKRQTTL